MTVTQSQTIYYHSGAYYGSTYRIDITEYPESNSDMRFAGFAVRLAGQGWDEYTVHGRVIGATAADCAATLGMWCGVDAVHKQNWHDHTREEAALAARRKQREEAKARRAARAEVAP